MYRPHPAMPLTRRYHQPCKSLIFSIAQRCPEGYGVLKVYYDIIHQLLQLSLRMKGERAACRVQTGGPQTTTLS